MGLSRKVEKKTNRFNHWHFGHQRHRCGGVYRRSLGSCENFRADVGRAGKGPSSHRPGTAGRGDEAPGAAPEYECWVPSLDSSEVPPMAQMPSFRLMALRKVLATSLLFTSWKSCKQKCSLLFHGLEEVSEDGWDKPQETPRRSCFTVAKVYLARITLGYNPE